MERGRFITFEGGEGVGKSTQIKLLQTHLERLGHKTIVTRNPGGTAGGQLIRELVLKGDVGRWTAMTEVLLMTADRAQHVEELILPSHEQGVWVLCDRFYDSSIVYQGAARGVGVDKVKELQKLALGDIKPDLTILMDMDVDKGLGRAVAREGASADAEDRFERMDRSLHETIRQTYLTLARKEQDRFEVVDADNSVEAIEALIWQTLKDHTGLSEDG